MRPSDRLLPHARLGGVLALMATMLAAPAIGQEGTAPSAEFSDEYTLADDLDQSLPDLETVQASGELKEHLEGYGNLRLADEARIVDGTLIEDGVCRAVFDSGVLVPVLSGKDDVAPREVGFVFFGNGRLQMSLNDRADAQRFANHMVMQANKTPEEMRPIAHLEKPYETTFKRAMVMTADRQMADIIRRLDPIGTGSVVTEMVLDDETRKIVEEMVITDTRGQMKARLQAAQIFPKRSRVLRTSGIDIVDFVQYDRMVHDLFAEPWQNLRMIGEFQTEDRFHVIEKRKSVDNPDDQWLTCFRDGFDHRGTGLRSTAFVHGITREKSLEVVEFGGERFGPRPTDGAPVPDRRVEPVYGKAKVELIPYKRLNFIRPRVKSEITLRATDDNVRHVVLRLPRDEANKGSFKITKLETLSGEEVDFMELDALQSRRFGINSSMAAPSISQGAEYGSDGSDGASAVGVGSNLGMQSFNLQEPTGVPQELLVVLPEALNVKDELTLNIEWQAEWQHGMWQVVQGNTDLAGGNQSNAYRPAGACTGPKRFLPELLPAAGGTQWDFQVEVGVPPRKLEAAVSGDTARTRVDDAGWRWTTSKGQDMRKPALAAGIWRVLEEPGAAGLPAINVYTFPTWSYEAPTFPPEVRRILLYLRRFMKLPKFYELDVYQGITELKESLYSRNVDQAAASMVGWATIKTGETVTSRSELTEENPFRFQSDLAQQMATQVWGQVVAPASSRDMWMVQSISDAFGMFYTRSAKQEEGFEAFEGRLEFVREQLENPREDVERAGQVTRQDRFLSLTDGGSLARFRGGVFKDYGFYVMARMLRERIGDFAFFQAIDRFSAQNAGSLVTTEQLQAAFEASSGQDLDHFFSYWIRGGFVPKVTLEYSLEPDSDGTFTVDGCITTDIPFGQFDMPVAILDQDGERGLGGMIMVEDGRGRFAVEGRAEDVELQADPYGLILSYGRKVQKVDQTTCAKEGGDRWNIPTDSGVLKRDADPDIEYDRTKQKKR